MFKTFFYFLQTRKTKAFLSGDPRTDRTNFLVKIQVPLDGIGDLLVYNKERDVHGAIVRGDNLYAELTQKIQKEGFGGLKGYFYAFRKNGKIKINPKRIQLPQPW